MQTRTTLLDRYSGRRRPRGRPRRITEADLDRPQPGGRMTARQVVHHLADSDRWLTSAFVG
jgi:hypothetical protein